MGLVGVISSFNVYYFRSDKVILCYRRHCETPIILDAALKEIKLPPPLFTIHGVLGGGVKDFFSLLFILNFSFQRLFSFFCYTIFAYKRSTLEKN